jgi:crossover junction endodeoxyribonuclease RuvC
LKLFDILEKLNKLRILGIDPGLRVTGFGVIEIKANGLFYLGSGIIKTNSKETSFTERLKVIIEGLDETIKNFKPNCVSIEKVFVNVNPQSTLLLGQARGAALSISVINKLPIHEYTALQIKKSVVGNGHADKLQVQSMVQNILNLPSPASEDSSDALAAAICHAHSFKFMSKITNINRIKGGRLI